MFFLISHMNIESNQLFYDYLIMESLLVLPRQYSQQLTNIA